MQLLKSVRVRFSAIVFLLLILVGAYACDNGFQQINSNPNEPEQVDPSLLLPEIIRGSVNNSVNYSMTTGNIVMQQTAKVLFGSIDRYNWESFAGYWNTYYNQLRNVQNLYTISKNSGDQNYEGIALVMRAWIFSQLTDAFGRVPYSEAIQAKQNQVYAPAYDSQQKIYEGMLANLKQANDLLHPGSGNQVMGDILYDGDIMKWKKFANSLRVRLLMHVSQKMDVSSDLQEIFNNPSKYPVFESNDDNASLEYLPSYPNQWPVHTWRVGTFQEYRVSKTFVDTLKKFDDPRLAVFAEPTSNSVKAGNPEYVGVPNGLQDDEAANYNGSPSDQSTLDQRYYQEPNSAKGLIMTYPQLLFLKAEASQKGLISENAEQIYNDGVKAAFDQYGLQADQNYLSQSGVQFDPNRALEQIGTQKWISLFFTGLEGWFEWRRTGYPDIEPSVRNQNNDRIPVRFMYPTEEQSLNSENYKQAVEQQGPDNINTKIWLVK